MVAVDGSEPSLKALNMTMKIVKEQEDEVIILSVVLNADRSNQRDKLDKTLYDSNETCKKNGVRR